MKRLPLPVACVAMTMLVSFAPPCVGADSEGAGTFSLHFENDLFGDTDQNYTSGFKLSWVSPDLTQYRDSRQLPQWSHKWIDMLPFIHEPGLQRNVVLSLGQSMYTPEDISRSDLIVDDRAYAGWLYVGTAFHNKILDGNTFETSHSIDKRYFVADFAPGASVIYDRYRLFFARAVRTRECRRQSGNHHFGSVTLSVTF